MDFGLDGMEAPCPECGVEGMCSHAWGSTPEGKAEWDAYIGSITDCE